MRDTIDLEAYLKQKVHITNTTGGRGFDTGVRTFNCPLCGELRNRGWMNVERWTAGCYNAGCPAEPRMNGGAIEWIVVAEKFVRRADAWAYLLREFYTEQPVIRQRIIKEPEPDFVRYPEGMRLFGNRSYFDRVPLAFIRKQWGLSLDDAVNWRLGFCTMGRYAHRIIIPIIMHGQVVAFQARAYDDREPKYLNSMSGPFADEKSECARPMGEVLFNLPGVLGEEVLLVEGVGDVMGWHKREHETLEPNATGILGLALTVEKLMLLRGINPTRVIVGMDNEPAARARAIAHMQDLEAFNMPAVLGEWQGGKDAGSGATIAVQSDSDTRGGKTRLLLPSKLRRPQ